jgi:hypothetical protein
MALITKSGTAKWTLQMHFREIFTNQQFITGVGDGHEDTGPTG